MKVELGNAKALRVAEDRDAPTVTYVEVPEEWTYEVAESGARMTIGPDNVVEVTSASALASAARDHITNAMLFRDGIFHLPGQEALLGVMAAQQQEGGGVPLWVWSDNEDFAKLLSEFYGGVPIGRPDDVEQSYFTDAGPPGVLPLSDAETEALAAVAVANEPTSEGPDA